MEVIILAGGLGTRLKSVVKDIPKPMALVNRKPFLEYILGWLSQYNITKIVISAGYKSEIIVNYFVTEYKNIPIEYAIETEPLGTGGGILNALTRIDDENVLIVNGDTYFPIDIDEFCAEHYRLNGLITIALKKMTNFDRYGSVSLDKSSNIVQFHEKAFQKEGLINGGIYFLNKKYILQLNLPMKFSFENEILEKEVINSRIKGKQFSNQFLDIGIPEDYKKADLLF